MLGTDFRYARLPEGVPVVQADIGGSGSGGGCRRVPLLGTVKDTVEALLP